MNCFNRAILAAAAVVALFAASAPANAAASAQVTHAFLCRPVGAGTSPVGGRVVNTSSTASPQPAYTLNTAGCALFAGADVGFFLSQGYYYGPSVFTAQAIGISGGSSGTTAEPINFTLPAYGYIMGVVLCETAGNAVTGGVDIGDSGSITRFASAVTLGANACVTLVDTALTRIYVTGGVPTASAIEIAAHAAGSWNSASVNVTILWTYF